MGCREADFGYKNGTMWRYPDNMITFLVNYLDIFLTIGGKSGVILNAWSGKSHKLCGKR